MNKFLAQAALAAVVAAVQLESPVSTAHFFIPDNAVAQNWWDAQATCEANDANLASLSHQADSDYAY